MKQDDELTQHASGSADTLGSPYVPNPQQAPDALDAYSAAPDPYAAPSASADAGAFEEPATLPHALLVPLAAPEQPAAPALTYRRRGPCLYATAGAAAIVVLLCAGLGVVALRATMGTTAAPRGRVTSEASRIAILTRTGTGTATPLPGVTFPPIPNAVIAFGGGTSSTTLQCNGPAPLDPVTLFLDNSHSTISVDWWIQITDTTPDGKLLWASGFPPYGTLPAGHSTSVALDPDPSLCTALVTARSAVTYHATVFYGGVGGFTVSVVVMPPGPGQVAAQPASA